MNEVDDRTKWLWKSVYESSLHILLMMGMSKNFALFVGLGNTKVGPTVYGYDQLMLSIMCGQEINQKNFMTTECKYLEKRDDPKLSNKVE